MFHNRTLNNKINELHERALRLAYKDDSSSFQGLLDSDDAVTIHCRNLQKLAIEMYKVKNNISPSPLRELFNENINSHDLRNKRYWEASNVRTVHYGTETIKNRGPNMGPLSFIKQSTSLLEFKTKIRKW